MRLGKLAVASVVLACDGVPQNFAPDVLLLARIKSHVREELSYTQLHMSGDYRPLPQRTRPFCAVHESLKPLDTVRLEIVYSDHREWHGSPGVRNLSVANPVAFIGSGLIGNGPFAMMLNNIIEGGINERHGVRAGSNRPVLAVPPPPLSFCQSFLYWS